MVPVLRNAEKMTFDKIENSIKDLAIKARDGKLKIDEMTGGTFTITNGGVLAPCCQLQSLIHHNLQF